MKNLGVALGTLGIAILMVTGVLAYKTFGSGLGFMAGGTGPAQITVSLDQAGIEAEIARLRELPGGSMPKSLGVMADARVACTVGTMGQKPNRTAMNAAARFYLIISAIRERAASPLVDPRIADFPVFEANSAEEVRLMISDGALSERQLERLALLVALYEDAASPIYAGLPLDTDGWAKSDLKNILLAGSANIDRVRVCVANKTAQ